MAHYLHLFSNFHVSCPAELASGMSLPLSLPRRPVIERTVEQPDNEGYTLLLDLSWGNPPCATQQRMARVAAPVPGVISI
jgi:hypothetical protein